LNQANFTLAQVQNCNLRETEAKSAKFVEANLSQSDFFGSQLTNCDFSGSNLSSADFTNADLSESLFGSAKLTATDFRYTVLRGARELTGLQLTGARTAQDTILPNGSKGPFVRGFGAEYPVRR
jgi:uncharacterized protein YjbI with pentapeptide repeats